MKITDQTTPEEIMAPVVAAKKRLLEEAEAATHADVMVGTNLLRAAQAVRNAEDLAHAQFRYQSVAKVKRARLLVNLLSEGADDRWSGRNNDSARASNDVIREWASETMKELI